ncbi:hypothetical protein Tco_1095266, partial [Tanacetum coccineum]
GRRVGRGVKEKHDSMVVLEYPNVSEAHGTQAQTSVSKENMNNVGTTTRPTPIGITPEGNGIDVVVPIESIQAVSESFANTTYGFFLGKQVAYPVIANYVRNTWGKYGLVCSMFSSSTGLFSFQFSSMDRLDAMLENAWVKLHGVPVIAFSEDGLSVIATKLGTPLMLDSYTSDMCMQSWGREGNYTCNIRVEYEWKPPKCASCKVFGHIPEECLKNIGAGEMKNLKKTSQAPKGIPVGPKKGVDHTDKLSDSDPFEVLNSVDNDVEMGTNEGGRQIRIITRLIKVDPRSGSTTPILDKIRKFENIIIYGQAILVDETDNPLKKVEYPGDQDSEDEVASVDNDMARSLALERTGFGTQSLLEQWRDYYGNGDYDEDLYDDDMYEGHDLFEEIQTICDKLDIRVRGRRK